MRNQKGFALLDTAVALAIMGVLAVGFISGVGTSFKAAITLCAPLIH